MCGKIVSGSRKLGITPPCISLKVQGVGEGEGLPYVIEANVSQSVYPTGFLLSSESRAQGLMGYSLGGVSQKPSEIQFCS